MNVDDRLPLFVGHFLNDAVPSIARIVHDDVQPAKAVHAGLDEPFGKTVFGDAAGTDHGLGSRCAYRLGGFIGRIRIQIVDHQPGPFRGQFESDFAANAPARARDQRHAPVEFSSHIDSSRKALSGFFIKRGDAGPAEAQIVLKRQTCAINLARICLAAKLLNELGTLR